MFGTLNPLLRQLVIPHGGTLQNALDEFKVFYNQVRPHQNLNGLRPADIQQMPIKEVRPVQALAGLMRSYWIGR